MATGEDGLSGRERRLANLEQHKFKPGQSGNPGGRPKTEPITTAYRKALAEVDPEDEGGRTYAEVLAERMILRAKSDTAALKEITDRVEGKAKQTLTLSMEQRDKLERAVQGMMNETGCTRDEAVTALAMLRPEAGQLIG